MSTRSEPLTRDRILDAALELLDADGPSGVSMRKVAARLGVQAMSLYHHVENKQALFDGMALRVVAGIAPPDPDLPWDARLDQIADRLFSALLAHPGAVLLLAEERGGTNVAEILQRVEVLVGALDDAGLPPTVQVNATRSLFAMVYGFVLTHTRGLTLSPERAAEVFRSASLEGWSPERTPRLLALAPTFLATPAATDFRFLLDAWLDALRRARRE
ncbi:MAG: TetR family transcriptional regulator [Alphaproteobacteria bacterium]|nr:TetR family transcriptional regulator [Alphaproteobacteria bacterium]